jgi:hypothetical protein
MDIQTQKNHTFFIGPVPFRLWLCVVVTPTHNVTHALRIGTGHSILTKLLFLQCGSEWDPVILPVFKTGACQARPGRGVFDSHTLPPNC